MTEQQAKALELIKKFEDLKDRMVVAKQEMEEALTALGIGDYFQDPVTKIVYKTEKPNGTFVHFSSIGFARTKKPEERAGSLAKTEAISNGFLL